MGPVSTGQSLSLSTWGRRSQRTYPQLSISKKEEKREGMKREKERERNLYIYGLRTLVAGCWERDHVMP
jgi:hypothetical protein